jgi:hypothetical protein
METKARPIYLVREAVGFEAPAAGAPTLKAGQAKAARAS